jgi:tetratricopeptide (TPR) repeat protein
VTTSDAELQRAEALLDLGRAEDARRHLARVVASDPENAAALGLLARALVLTGRPADALVAANRAAAADPESSSGHLFAAVALVDLEQYDEAARAAREAVRLSPEHAWCHILLTYALSGCAENMRPSRRRRTAVAEARAAGHEAVRLAPESADAHAALGYVAFVAGPRRAAVASLRRALELDPTHAVASNNLGALRLNSYRLFGAGQTLGAALRSDPSLELAKDNLRLVLARALAVANVAALVAVALHLWALSADSAAAGTAGRAAVGALLVGGLAGTAVALRRGPRGIRRYFLLVLRRRPVHLLFAALTTVAYGNALAIAVVPARLATDLAYTQIGMTVAAVPTLLVLTGFASFCRSAWRAMVGPQGSSAEALRRRRTAD